MTVKFSIFIALDGIHSPLIAIIASSVCVLLTFLLVLTLTAMCSIMIIRKKKSSESKKLHAFLSPNSCLYRRLIVKIIRLQSGMVLIYQLKL